MNIRQLVKDYKQKLKRELELKSMIINKDFDLNVLETFIQKCNNDPNLHCTFTLRDGTVINLCTYKQSKIDPYLGD